MGGRYRGAQTTNTSQACLCLTPAPVYSSDPRKSLPTSQTYSPLGLVPHPRPADQGAGPSIPCTQDPLCPRRKWCAALSLAGPSRAAALALEGQPPGGDRKCSRWPLSDCRALLWISSRDPHPQLFLGCPVGLSPSSPFHTVHQLKI